MPDLRDPSAPASNLERHMMLGILDLVDTRPWRLQSWLLDFARPGQEAGDHDSYNPVRRSAGWVACRMQDFMIRRLRQSFSEGEAR